MIKGTIIKKVIIDKEIITAYDEKDNIIKLTRTQRNLLSQYKNPDYIKNIIKEFSNPNILSKEYIVIKNNNIVYSIK